MKSVRKIFKLLCFVLVTIFMFGGEVFAIDAPSSISISKGSKWYDNGLTNNHIFNTDKKTTIDNEKYYTFCLDRGLAADYSGTLSKIGANDSLSAPFAYQNNWKSNVSRVMTKAYNLGLDASNSDGKIGFHISDTSGNSNYYETTNSELYGIAQCAIWLSSHGKDTNGTKGGLTPAYESWCTNGKRAAIYEYLSNNSNMQADSLNIKGSSKMSEQNIDGQDYLVSEEFTVSANFAIENKPTLTASISGTGFEFQITRDNKVRNWSSSNATVKDGDKIKIRVLKPSGSGKVSANFKIESSTYVTGYDSYFYQASGLKLQNMSLVLPKTGKLSKTVKVEGNYDTDYYLKVLKVDASDSSNILSGALLKLYKSGHEDDVISEFSSSQEGFLASVSELGTYCVKEISAPTGYLLNSNEVCIDVTDSNDSADNAVVINLQNTKKTQKYVKFRKVYIDENGNYKPLAGVQVKLVDYMNRLVSNDSLFMCATSNDQGYFTQACDIDTPVYNADGKYPLVEPLVVDGVVNPNPKLYEIHEKFLDGYYNPNFGLNNNDSDFAISDGFFFVNANNIGHITMEEDPSDSNVVIVNIVNEKNYLNISKTDTGTGNEIPGAEMIVYRKGAIDEMSIADMALSSDMNLKEIVDIWTSDGTPHTIQGITPGETYVLSETVAPDGYVSLTTDIEFTVDADGNVEVLSKEQTLVKPKDDTRNWLIVGNDLLSVPKTGLSILNLFAIGGLMVFVGYEVIKIYRRRADI